MAISGSTLVAITSFVSAKFALITAGKLSVPETWMTMLGILDAAAAIGFMVPRPDERGLHTPPAKTTRRGAMHELVGVVTSALARAGGTDRPGGAREWPASSAAFARAREPVVARRLEVVDKLAHLQQALGAEVVGEIVHRFGGEQEGPP